MQAMVFCRYGAPRDVLKLEHIAKPTPQADEVLIKVHAAGANAADWHLIRADPFLVRMDTGLTRPKNTVPGIDVAGTVEAVGANVTDFKAGDAVFGELSRTGMGGYAEYVCTKPEYLTHKPDNIRFEEAAVMAVAGVTALQGLRKYGDIQAGQQVLVNGAAGGVGHFAVQLAKHFGAQVTGVCSDSKADFVRSLGADDVIDYAQTDFTRTGRRYDFIFDAVGNRSAADYARALKPSGKYVMIGFTTFPHMLGQIVILGGLRSRLSDKTIGMLGSAQPNRADLTILADLLAAGAIKPVLERCYPLEETAAAIDHLEQGNARGKLAVMVAG